MSGLSIFMRRLQRLDAYPKLKEDYREKTLSGAAISIIAGIFMLVLFASEFTAYLVLDTQHELVVDTGRGGQLRINMNITFRQMPCNVLSLDAMDISGRFSSLILLRHPHDCCFITAPFMVVARSTYLHLAHFRGAPA